MPFPFEVSFDQVQSDVDTYVDEILACLESEFLVMPKGPGFVEYPTFESGYEALKRATTDFQRVTPATVTPVVFDIPISLIVLSLHARLHAAGMGLLRHPGNRHRNHPGRCPHS